jgi:hypothetical protein
MIRHTLDPLLRYLTAHYVDDADLTDRLQRLFKVSTKRVYRSSANSSQHSDPLACSTQLLATQ